jgi:hypothetical protein
MEHTTAEASSIQRQIWEPRWRRATVNLPALAGVAGQNWVPVHHVAHFNALHPKVVVRRASEIAPINRILDVRIMKVPRLSGSTNSLLHTWCTPAGTVSSAIESKPIARIMTSALRARIDEEGTSMPSFDVRALNIVRPKRYVQAAEF